MKELNVKYLGLPLWQWLAIAAGLYIGWEYILKPQLAPPVPAVQPGQPLLLAAPADTSAANFISAPTPTDYVKQVADATSAPQPAQPLQSQATPINAGKLDPRFLGPPIALNTASIGNLEEPESNLITMLRRMPNAWGRR